MVAVLESWQEAASTTVTKPTGVVAGDLLLLAVNIDTGFRTATLPSGFTAEIENNDNTNRAILAWKIAGASEPADYTVTLSGASTIAINLMRISGANTSAPLVATGVDSVNEQSPAVSSDALVILLSYAANVTGSISCDIGAYVDRIAPGSDADLTVYQVADSGGGTVGPANWSGFASMVGVSAAIAEAEVDIQVPTAETDAIAYAPPIAGGGGGAVFPAAETDTIAYAPAIVTGAFITPTAAVTDADPQAPTIQAGGIPIPTAETDTIAYPATVQTAAIVTVPAAESETETGRVYINSVVVPAAESVVTAYAPTVITARPTPRRTYLVEFDHHDGASLQTTRLTSGYGYRSAPSDTPANTKYEPFLISPGEFEVTAFQPGRTIGIATVNAGVVRCLNETGRFDGILDDGFDGREVRISVLPDEFKALTFATRLFTGSMEQAAANTDALVLRLRDKLTVLDRDLLTNTYAGTTTDGTAGGAEGDSNLKDALKPRLYGSVKNVPTLRADAFNHIRQVSDQAVTDITAVYDRGAELLDPDTDHANLTALEAATVQGGRFETAHALGLFKLGSKPGGDVTADVLEGATAADRTAAQVAKRILLDHPDISVSDLVDSTFTALDTANSAEVGIYIGGQGSYLDAINEVLSSVGAFLTVTPLGKFAVYRQELPDPTDTPVATFDEHIITADGLIRRPTGDQGNGIPACQVRLGWGRNYTVQDADSLSGRARDCLSESRKQFLSKPNQEAIYPASKDATVLAKHPQAPTLTFDTLLVNRADAEAESQRRYTIYSTKRPRYAFTVPIQYAQDVWFDKTIKLTFPRFGLNSGLLFRPIGLTFDYDDDTVTIDAWGGVTPA